jgi:hypothetical protein
LIPQGTACHFLSSPYCTQIVLSRPARVLSTGCTMLPSSRCKPARQPPGMGRGRWTFCRRGDQRICTQAAQRGRGRPFRVRSNAPRRHDQLQTQIRTGFFNGQECWCGHLRFLQSSTTRYRYILQNGIPDGDWAKLKDTNRKAAIGRASFCDRRVFRAIMK